MITRRTALHLLLSGGGAVLLSACTTPAPAAPTVAPTPAPAAKTAPTAAVVATVAPKPAAAAAAQPKTGGTLRLGMVGDVSTVDGHNTTPNQFDTTWSVFDRL